MAPQDTKWGENLFVGTKIIEVNLPLNIAEMKDSSLSGIRFLHLGNKSDVLIDYAPSLFKYLAQFGEKSDNLIDANIPLHPSKENIDGIDDSRPRIYLICGSDKAREDIIAEVERYYNAKYNTDEGAVYRYFKEKISGTSESKELTKIATIFAGSEVEIVGDYLVSVVNDTDCIIHTYLGTTFEAIEQAKPDSAHKFDFKKFYIIEDDYNVIAFDDFAFYNKNTSDGSDTREFSLELLSIGDFAFYSARLPKNVDLGGCVTLGHGALAKQTETKNIAGLSVETVGYYACGGYSTSFINMPRLSAAYGYCFKLPARLDIGLVQFVGTRPTDYYANLLEYDSGSWNTAVIIHTEHISAVPTALIKFGRQASYQTFAPDIYKDLLINGGYTGTNSFQPLGGHTADTLGVLTYDGRDVTGEKFIAGNYLYCLNDTSTEYVLIKCITTGTIDGAAWSKDRVFTIPAYTDGKGRTTRSARGSTFAYQTINDVETFTFANEYLTIGGSFFGGSSYAGNKYIAHLDLNKVETVGSSAFYLSKSLITVTGNHVTSIGASAFEQCAELRTATFPNVTFGANSKAFLSCPQLHTAVIGPQYAASDIFRNCPKLNTVYINMTDIDPEKKKDYLTLQGGTNSSTNENLNVIAIGHELTWEKSVNSPCWNMDNNPDNNVVDTYSLVAIDADINTIIFADWVDGAIISVQLANSNDSKYTYTHTISTPTYMFSEATGGELTIQLAMGLSEIVQDTYVVPNTLYKSSEAPVTTILGTQTVKYYTTEEMGVTSGTGKKVVGIETNIYNGKITVNSIVLPEGLKRIGNGAFANCTFRSDLIIDGAESGLEIGDGAFKDAKMSSLTISNVTSIGKEAFMGVKHRVTVEGGSQIDNPIAVQLGNRLYAIGESAFENAWISSITTTHGNDKNTFLEIGEYAFKNVKNGAEDKVAINLGNAVVTFCPYSFQNVSISNLYAPNTIRVQANAFYMVDVSGTVDFSEGVPEDIASAYEPQTIEPYGFRGTSADKNQLGVIKLGRNCLLMGDYYASDGVYPVKEGKQAYKGAFYYCDIKSLQFNAEVAQEPQALAFVGCSFKEIRLAALTTIGINYGGLGNTNNSKSDDVYHQFRGNDGVIKDNRPWTKAMFVNCTTLGDVYFTNITDFSFVFRDGSGHEINLKDMPALTTIKANMFLDLTLVGEPIYFPNDLVIEATGFANTIAKCDLYFGTNTTLKSGEVFRDARFYGDVYFGEGLKVTAQYPFNRSKAYGTISIGSISYTADYNGCGMFGNSSSSTNVNGNLVTRLVLRETCTEIPKKMLAYANFTTIDLSQSSVTKAGTAAFAHSTIGTIIGLEKIQEFGDYCFGDYWRNSVNKATSVTTGLDISGATSIGTGAFVNMTFSTPVSLTKILEIKASAFKNCTFNQPLSFGSLVGTNILDNAFEGAKFNSSIDLSGVKTVGASSFKSATFSETLQLKDITSFGAHAFTNAIVNGDLIFGTRTGDAENGYAYSGPEATVGEYAFGSLTIYDDGNTVILSYLPGITVAGEVQFVNVKGIGANGFRGALLSEPLTFGVNIAIGDSAFYGITVPAVTFTGSPVIEANAFKQSHITTLTFLAAGEIKAEAFAEGTYGTIKLGSVTLIEGTAPENIRMATENDMPTGWTQGRYWMADNPVGAFRASSIGSVYFEDAAEPGFLSFRDCKIGYLHFGNNITSLGSSTYNKNDNNGTYSAVQGATIDHLNLGKVGYVGNSYFVSMTIGTVDPVLQDITFNWWSLASVQIGGDLVFKGKVTLNGFVFAHNDRVASYSYNGKSAKINGNLRFEGGIVNNDTGQNKIYVTGDVYIKCIEYVMYQATAGNDSILSGAVIDGKFTIAEGAIYGGFSGVTFNGEIDLSGVTSFPNNPVHSGSAGIAKTFSSCIFKTPSITLSSAQFLGNGAFINCTFAIGTTIYLNSATEIDQSAFANTKNLSILIAPELKTIGTDAFLNCTSLFAIYLNNITEIEENAFANLTNLSTFSAPKVEIIGSNAFLNCTSLVAIDLPALKQFSGTSPFVGCTALKTVIIGEQFENWGTGAFDSTNTALETVILKTPIVVENHGNVPSVTNITGTIGLPDNTKFLVPKALESAYKEYFGSKKYNEAGPIWGSITTANFSTIELILSDNASGVNYLAIKLYSYKIEIVDIIDTSNAMRNATFTFPNSLTDGTETYIVVSISADAMRRISTSVTNIVLPTTLEYVNFTGLDTHNDVLAYSIAEESVIFKTIDGVLYTEDGKTLVLYPSGKQGDVTIPSSVERIGYDAFAGNQYVTSVTFTSNIAILDGAFTNCVALTEIVFEASVSEIQFIGRDTVSGCILTGANKLAIQVSETSHLVVLYDTKLFSLIVKA